MIDSRKILSHSLSAILACSLFGGIGFTANGVAQNSTSTQSTSSGQTAPMTAAQKRAAKRAAKKEAKQQAQQQKATDKGAAPMATGNQPKAESSTASKTTESRSTRGAMATHSSTASSSDIANARSKGLVWVNTETKVYHTGGRYYGNTKHGQFMSQADAEKAGYKAAKR